MPRPASRGQRQELSRQSGARLARSVWQTPLPAAQSAWGQSIDFGAGSSTNHLVQRTLIDGHANVFFQAADVFAGNIFCDGSIERLGKLLRLLRLHIECRQNDVRYSKYHPLQRLGGIALSSAVLGRLEHGIDGGG